MIVDLHAHYAMHLVEELHPNPLRALRSALSPASDTLVSKLRASLSSTEEQLQFDRHRRRRRRRAILRSLFSLDRCDVQLSLPRKYCAMAQPWSSNVPRLLAA